MATQLTETLITEAARTGSSGLYSRIISSLTGQEVYLSVLPPQQGQSQPRFGFYPAGSLSHVVRFFTSANHPNLGRPYAGMRWEAAIEMLRNLPEADGVQIINEADDWIAVSKDALPELGLSS